MERCYRSRGGKFASAKARPRSPIVGRDFQTYERQDLCSFFLVSKRFVFRRLYHSSLILLEAGKTHL